MNLSWDQVSKGFRDSTFTLKLSGLKTAEWTALVGPGLPEATVSGNAVVRSDHDGRDLKATLSASVDDLVAKIGGRTVRGARAGLLMEVMVLDFNDIGISRLSLDVQKGPTRLLTVGGTLNHSLSRQETGAQFSAEVDVPAVLAEVPVEGVMPRSAGFAWPGRCRSRRATPTSRPMSRWPTSAEPSATWCSATTRRR